MKSNPEILASNFLGHWSVVLVLSLLTHVPAHSEPLEAALQSCNTCHGANGVSAQAKVPHLNGQLAASFVDAMQSFAKGSRPSSVPEHQRLPAEQLAGAGKFYETQKTAPRPKQVTDAAMVTRGEKNYANRCADCHVDNGRESDKDAPLLAAQDLEFLVAQTLAFKTGVRKFPFLMDDAYRGLSDDDLASVAHFFAAQDQVAPAAPGKKKRGKSSP